MRKAHLLHHNRRAVYPVQAIFLDTETTSERVSALEERHVLTFAWACFIRRHRGWSWSPPEWRRFESGADFWEWVVSKTRPRTRLYLYAHNAAYDLTVLGTWSTLPRMGWRLTRAILDAPPFIAHWKQGDKKISVVDTLNLWRVPLSELGEHVGLPKRERPPSWNDREESDHYCKRDVEIILHASVSWWSFLRQHDLGSAEQTIAAQAMTTYRHRHLSHKILIDDNRRALGLSREGYFGGRTDVYRLGHVPGPLYFLDVRSEYPTVMAGEEYPRWLHSIYRTVAVEELREILRERCAVAQVELETPEPVYPYRNDGPLLFPVGRFETVLTTPELEHALKHDRIIRLGEVAVYDRAPLFRSFVTYLYNLRREAAQRGDRVNAFTLKLLMNSLYGKFGQRSWRSETVGHTEDLTPKIWDEYDHKTERRYRFRQLAGTIEMHWQEGETLHSHPAIAAHVTAHGRRYLWWLMNRAGRENVVYVDTDSLLVTADGYRRLEDLCEDDRIGYLRLELTADSAEMHGLKDYQVGPCLRVKGVRANAEWKDDHTVVQERWLGLRSLLWRGDISAPIVRKETRVLERIYRKGIVLSDGFTRPFRLPGESGLWRGKLTR